VGATACGCFVLWSERPHPTPLRACGGGVADACAISSGPGAPLVAPPPAPPPTPPPWWRRCSSEGGVPGTQIRCPHPRPALRCFQGEGRIAGAGCVPPLSPPPACDCCGGCSLEGCGCCIGCFFVVCGCRCMGAGACLRYEGVRVQVCRYLCVGAGAGVHCLLGGGGVG
jgi:hypothetical protein